MEVLYICLLLLVSTGLGDPNTDRRGIRRAVRTLREKGNYGIVGGHSADIKKYPYTVSFTFAIQNFLLGGGAIINKNWIVCSAFELYGYTPQDISVRVGSNNAASGGQQLNVSKIIAHEKFHIDYPYDVAVVKTSKPIKLGKQAKPVKLAKSTPKAGTKAEVTGFGDTEALSLSKGNLQFATVQVKTQSECQKAHPSVGDTCLCADADNVGPCSNDIGDPLVKNRQLYGYFLGGDYCNYLNVIEIYSNVATLRQWILDKIKQNSNEDEMEGIDDDDFYGAFEEYDEKEEE